MNIRRPLSLLLIGCICIPAAFARDRIKLETTVIKGNKEMPQIVYIVPWRDFKRQHPAEQTLVLHSLFGGLFDPVHSKEIQADMRTNHANHTKLAKP